MITKRRTGNGAGGEREYFHEMDIIGWFQTVPTDPCIKPGNGESARKIIAGKE